MLTTTRRTPFALCGLMLALALSTVAIGVEEHHSQDLTAATSAAIPAYQPYLGGSQFNRTYSQSNEMGYTVESGRLLEKEREVGALVVVTAPDGGVTAIIDREGARGLLQVDAQGFSRFTPEPDHDYLHPDSEPGDIEPVEADSAVYQADSQYPIDALVAFSHQALSRMGGNSIAFALAQLETANLGIRNSRIEGVELKLAGIRVTQTNHDTTSDGLRAWQNLLTPLRAEYRHDINVAYGVGGDAGGRAYMPGWTSVNEIRSTLAFRHEMGHNVGGSHCNTNGQDNYKFGHNNGQGSRTFLCGNNVSYYSTPDIRLNGYPLGDARTANVARLWREQSVRLSGYSPAFEGDRMIVAPAPSVLGSSAGLLRIPSGRTVGIVATDPAIGPTALVTEGDDATALWSFPLQAEDGSTHIVKMLGIKMAASGCGGWHALNYAQGCDAGAMNFNFGFSPLFNPDLPAGYYNGTVELMIRDDVAGWTRKVLVSVAAQR